MLNKEINAILNIHNDEDGIASVITESLIRYYSVNGISHDQFQNNYLNYLRMIFSGRQFHFLDKEKLLSYKDQILSTVLPIVRDDLMEKVQPEELFQSSQWQPEPLPALLVELFDNRQILSIVSQ
ncbi:hypothetical protein [Erwinia sp. V71]|uniref:hypothetical protein n=1 Tax=Erwinia sp. V71 TaxID=3369424 RepID=UPI003F6154BF